MADDINQVRRDLTRMGEKVELLMGSRGDATKSQSALRRAELRPLASIDIKSKQLTAAPTMADYNALQADVAAMFDALRRLSNALGNASLPRPIP